MGYVITTVDGELYHYGVKGMKLGVRHDKPTSGTRRSARQKKKSKLRQKYEAKASIRYQDMGLSKKDADAAAQKRADVAKKVLIGAGVALGVSVGIAAYRYYGRVYCDDIIKSGTKIQSVTFNPDKILNGESFYLSHRKYDNLKYQKLFAENKFTGEIKDKVTGVTNSTIKSAGKKEYNKAFKELMSKDSEFRKAVEMEKNTNPQYKLVPTYWGKSLATKVNAFSLHSDGNDTIKRKIFDNLKSKGYDGVLDLNDRQYSGYNSKAVILFDNKVSKLTDLQISKLSKTDVTRGQMAVYSALMSEKLIAPTGVALTSAVVYKKKVNNYDAEVANEYEKSKNKKSS